jgi:hypothetical protein
MKLYKYLGSNINGENSIKEEIKKELFWANKVRYANKKNI